MSLHQPSKPLQKDSSILIIGAGVFGLTTALELSKRGYTNITVVDRYLPPVPDGSSVDISRVIRPDYADQFYARLGLEALRKWEEEEGYREFFSRSGLLCLSLGDHEKGRTYVAEGKKNVERLGMEVESVKGPEDVRRKWPGMKLATEEKGLSHVQGYFNKRCGWANAKGAIGYLVERCNERGVNFVSGKRGTVIGLIVRDDNRVLGVRTADGGEMSADIVVVATGAWTASLLDMRQTSISTGQPVGFLQLTKEEAAALKDSPIVIDLSTGWFCFPPTPDTHVLKMARHGYGYETRRPGAATNINNSTPISVPSLRNNNTASQFIPEDAERALRDRLEIFFPQFKDREFCRRRLCWYTDTATGDFIVDYHPKLENLFVASGGSGHAFKFLPILGHYVVDAIELKESEEQQKKWKWSTDLNPKMEIDGSRGGPARRILSRQEQNHLDGRLARL